MSPVVNNIFIPSLQVICLILFICHYYHGVALFLAGEEEAEATRLKPHTFTEQELRNLRVAAHCSMPRWSHDLSLARSPQVSMPLNINICKTTWTQRPWMLQLQKI